MLPERVWFLRASIFALVGIVFLVWSLYNVPILYKVKFKCVNSSFMRSKSSFKTELHLRVILGLMIRGSQLGREKQQGSSKFSIMGERCYSEQTSSTSHLNACLWSFCVFNRRPASIMLLSWSSYTEEFTCKLDCSLYLSGSCRSYPKRNWKQYFILVQNLGSNRVLGGVQITNPWNSFYSHPRTVFLGSSIL